MSKEPDFSKIKGHAYHGRSTGKPELDQAIRAGGAVPGGLRPSVPVNDLVVFHDPQTGSTLTLEADQVTAESVTKRLTESRAEFAARKSVAQEKLSGMRRKS